MGMHKNFACHLGPGFHSIQIFISLTLSAPKKAVKISYSKYIHLVEQKSIHQNSRNAKIGRGSKVRDSGTRGEGGHCDSHG